MRIRVLIVVLSAALGAALAMPSVAQSPGNVSRDMVAAHWLPQTAATARLYTWAAAQVQQSSGDDLSAQAFRQRWQARVDEWSSRVSANMFTHQLADGRWGHWVSNQSTGSSTASAANTLRWTDMPDELGGQWWLWQAVMARQVVDIWQQADRLDGPAIFAPLLNAFESAGDEAVAHARAQADRVARMHAARSDQTRRLIRGSLILAQAQFEWSQGQQLQSVWLSLEGLMRLARSNDQQNIGFYADWLQSLPIERVRSLQSIDVQFPVIVALLQDSAAHLEASERKQAHDKLAQAYAHLSLVGSGMAAYLDQPVRDGLVDIYQRCPPSAPGEAALDQARCIEDIAQALLSDISSEELVGATGPLSATFLKRELDLVSWQRARYLDSYLNWQLDSQCPVPAWFNALEWNLGAYHLRGLIAEEARDATPVISGLLDQNKRLWQQTQQWLDCIAGVGGERADIVMRLMRQHQLALEALEAAIDQAYRNHASEALAIGSDVSLDEPVSRQTEYQNSALVIGPCDPARTCGARASLPVNEALLALVPEGFWLAEQLQMGQVKLCYDNVRWIDRQQMPARHNDSGVADYTGRLSFTLDAHFERAEASEEIFSHRLESNIRATYFFAQADEAQLAMACPHGLDGQPIESELSGNNTGLVPDRLTYFTSVPTSTTAHLLANWVEGDQWRSRFAQSDGVNIDVAADDSAIVNEAEVKRIDLIDRRERALATRLSNLDSGQSDPLAQAIQKVETLSHLVRQAMALHHAPIIRHDQSLRSSLWGNEGLLTRALIREARDQGTLMSEVAQIGRQRNERLLRGWQAWPDEVRQLGLMPPELQWAQALLVERLNPETSSGERPKDP